MYNLFQINSDNIEFKGLQQMLDLVFGIKTNKYCTAIGFRYNSEEAEMIIYDEFKTPSKIRLNSFRIETVCMGNRTEIGLYIGLYGNNQLITLWIK